MRALYLLLLIGCLMVTLPLEVVVGARVYRRPLRLLLSVVPVLALFTAWDLYAIADHQWRYARSETLGLRLPGNLPVEELAFFVVIPVCSILTFEAVRRLTASRAGNGARGSEQRPQ